MSPLTTSIPDSHVSEAMLPRAFRVVSAQEETSDTITLVFEPSDGRELTFRPGQYTMLYVFGVGEVPISISGDPRRPEILVHTIRAVGAVTRALVGMRAGDVVGVRGPFGAGWPVSEAMDRDVLVVAGGIGLAPLRPVLYEAVSNAGGDGRVSLVYGARSPSDLLYRDEFTAWKETFGLDVQVTVDVSDRGWRGDVGMVTGLLTRVPLEPGETVALLCGPEVMMKVVARALMSVGFPPEDIHVSIERNMKCAIGLCGHCQFGASFACWGGPVFSYAAVADRWQVAEI
ncbi:MAG: FAD/NAD(P)-binding protein [Acidimicrobiia bacterium]